FNICKCFNTDGCSSCTLRRRRQPTARAALAVDCTSWLFTALVPTSSKRLEGVTPSEERTMRMFDVQGIEIRAPRDRVFEFLSNPRNLPQWAHAFTSVEDERARLQTPMGAVDVHLSVSADAETGTVDWRLGFPDGTVGLAQSRV